MVMFLPGFSLGMPIANDKPRDNVLSDDQVVVQVGFVDEQVQWAVGSVGLVRILRTHACR